MFTGALVGIAPGLIVALFLCLRIIKLKNDLRNKDLKIKDLEQNKKEVEKELVLQKDKVARQASIILDGKKERAQMINLIKSSDPSILDSLWKKELNGKKN